MKMLFGFLIFLSCTNAFSQTQSGVDLKPFIDHEHASRKAADKILKVNPDGSILSQVRDICEKTVLSTVKDASKDPLWVIDARLCEEDLDIILNKYIEKK